MKPLFRINAHVFYYGIMLGIGTGVAIGISKSFSKPDAEKLEELQRKYPELVQKSKQQRQEMQAFFDKMKDPAKRAELDVQFDEVLKRGKSDVKRAPGNESIHDKTNINTSMNNEQKK